MKKTYVSGNLSRKKFWDFKHKKIKNNKAKRNTWFGGFTYKNKDTKREYVTFISYTRRDNNINEGKFLRRLANKKIRHMTPEQLESYKYSDYKRLYDYAWEIY